MQKTIIPIVLATLCLNFKAKAQEPLNKSSQKRQVIVGKVISASSHDPLPGAVVKINPTHQTTVTDNRGEFTVNLPSGKYSLSVYYLSHKDKAIEILVPLKEKLLIKLDVEEQSLKEVEVNAGYYTVKDRERTGSISRVTAETIGEQPVNNPLQSLQGRMPGVQITQENGIPGGGFNVQIRGQNSLRNFSGDNGNEPFYLIDGVPFPSSTVTTGAGGSIMGAISPLSIINPSDIESIEVLKDADATAIYGSRGANGVVLITTKKGRSGKTSSVVNFQTGIGQVAKMTDVLNTQQYLEMRTEAFRNDQSSPGLTDYDLNGTWNKDRYTNWQKELIGGTSHQTNLSASINGGGLSTQFLFSGALYRETTVFPGDYAYNKGTGHFNFHHLSSNQKFNLTLNVDYGRASNNQIAEDLTASAVTLPPNAPAIYDEHGNLNWQNSTWQNPFAQLRKKYHNTTKNFISNTVLSYDIYPGIRLMTSMGYNHILLNELLTKPISANDPSMPSTGSAIFVTSETTNWIAEPQIEFNHKFGKGDLKVLMGSTFQENLQEFKHILGTGYTSDALIEDIASAPAVRILGANDIQYRYNALYGRINFKWDEKYIVNLTARRDGSSRFGPGKQFGDFGAAGLAWVFSNEPFIKKLSFLGFGKLRMSYGLTGSDQILDYGYMDTYESTYPYHGSTSIIPTRLANSNYGWETNRKFEAALNLGVFKDRLTMELSWYKNRSSNQLVGYALPGTTGFTSVQYNLPATVQNTGLELSLEAKIIDGHTINWRSSFNISIPKNKLIEYPDIESSSYANVYEVGKSLFQTKKLNYIGVDPNTGLYRFLDRNKDGNDMGDEDQSAVKKLGQEFYGGLQNTFQFKGFHLDVFLQFVKQTGNSYIYSMPNAPGFMLNQPIQVLNRWKQPGDQSDTQRFTQDYASQAYLRYAYNTYSSDHVITDASYIKLKSVSFSYQLGSALMNRLKLQGCKLYLQGQNLFTFTNYIGFDPENQNVTRLPPLRTITAGIQITL